MLRRYQGTMSDSSRWERFGFRPDDVVISTPAKCGTTWTQQIVGSLLLDRPVLGVPISEISPWLDMKTRTDDEVFTALDAQTHRRFIKTHTPLDGVPYHESVTYFAVARHPLDVALSDKDHGTNMDRERAVELIQAATGKPLVPNTTTKHPDSDDEHTHLRWFIDNDNAPTGSGPNGLADYCDQISVCWNRRHLPNVHLLHYHDMWNDLAGEMRRVADALGVPVDDDRWHEFVEAATLDSMRGRAAEAAPEAHVGMWQNTDAFFHKGGRRKWAEVLSDEELARFHERLDALAGEAAPWALGGRSALA